MECLSYWMQHSLCSTESKVRHNFFETLNKKIRIGNVFENVADTYCATEFSKSMFLLLQLRDSAIYLIGYAGNDLLAMLDLTILADYAVSE